MTANHSEDAGRIAYLAGENLLTSTALFCFVLLVGLAIFGHWLVPYDPLLSNASATLKPPSVTHWFGTDHLGRDIFSRVIVATRLDLGIAVLAVALSIVGKSYGGLCGLFCRLD
jgi:peptide/nickel transport system permease protein